MQAPKITVPFCHLASLMDRLDNLISDTVTQVAVAVSGGIDSVTLLMLLWQWQQLRHPDIHLISLTVDHRLRLPSAEEARYVQELSVALGVEHHTFVWQHDDVSHLSNLEAVAREKRYEFLVDFCHRQGVEYLCLAHHRQDQAENVLIRLFRGSGIEGLSSMQPIRSMYGINFVRPLLDDFKEDLEYFLVANHIKWYEDETNSTGEFLRNKIRRFLQGLPNSREIVQKINTSVTHINHARELMETQLHDLRGQLYRYHPAQHYYQLFRPIMRDTPEDLLTHVLAEMLMTLNGSYYKPRRESLLHLLQLMLQPQPPKHFTLGGCMFSYGVDNSFLVYREYAAIQEPEVLTLLPHSHYRWDDRVELQTDATPLRVHKQSIQSLNKLLRAIKQHQVANPFEQDWYNLLLRSAEYRQIECTLPVQEKTSC